MLLNVNVFPANVADAGATNPEMFPEIPANPSAGSLILSLLLFLLRQD